MEGYIAVTGACGFIGSNIIKQLNQKGFTNIIAIDDLENGHKFVNLVGLKFVDYLNKTSFLDFVFADKPLNIKAVFHQGACSKTTEWDGNYMMENNYQYSKILLHYCLKNSIKFIYASSAAVYGASNKFKEEPKFERPLNVYGFSKLTLDNYVREILKKGIDREHQQIVGLRYFNVYGPNEQHKKSMASVAYHNFCQWQKGEPIKLFGAYDGYEAGHQMRDFIYVEDICKLNLWFFDNPKISGVFNAGTGVAAPFIDIARGLEEFTKEQGLVVPKIEFIDFPEHLKNSYQSFTQADISSLRQVGYKDSFASLREASKAYFSLLHGDKKITR